MITGYNTDIEFQGVTYHIQTEDKGLSTPMIMSLVYDRGTILASKREPYEDLIASGFDEKVLAERLRKQHKTICAAVRKGRIEELKTLTKNGSSKKAKAKTKDVPDLVPIDSWPSDLESGAANSVLEDLLEVNPPPPVKAEKAQDVLAPIPMPEIGFAKKPQKPLAEPVIEGVAVLDVSEVVPLEAVRVVSDLAGMERPDSNKLSLEFLGNDTFNGGTNCNVTVIVCRGGKRKVIEGAEVMVKVLGSSFRPLIFHSLTDKNGISNVALQLPNFNTGRASILVRAISNGEEVEVRRPVKHG